MGRSRGPRQPEKGASLVEFALVMPLLLLLLLGIVEFGLVFGHYNELRHGAREGARFAAVSRPDYDSSGSVGNSDVIAVVCDAVDLPGASPVEVSLQLTSDDDGDGNPDRLDYGTLTVTATVIPLTGVPIISSFLPDTITNDAVFRLEQDGEWSPFGPTACP